MKEAIFRGSCTAIITPFSEDGVDLVRMKRLLNLQRQGGTAAIVLAGTTGENAVLTAREYETLVATAIAHVGGGMKMIVGVGGNNTAECLEKARFAAASGADAVLMTAPYYNKTTQKGLVRHFSSVADGSPVPVILYNVPSRTVIGISAESYLALSRHQNVNGVKEASGDFTLISRIVSECGDDLRLYCGNDEQTVPMMALGADGVISVASNLVPNEITRLTDFCLKGDFDAARTLHRRLAPLFRALFLETNPIPVKAGMAMMGLDSGTLRLPLVELSEGHKEELRACLQKFGLLKAS